MTERREEADTRHVPRFPSARVGLAVDAEARALPHEEMYTSPRVSRLVREALLSAGLGKNDPLRPLADIIHPGDSVLLKPNWVLHENEGDGGIACLYTHPEFILAALREVLAAGAERVVLGDAPIQSCDWDRLVTEDLRGRIQDVSSRFDASVSIVDFRRTTLSRRFGIDHVDTDRRASEQYVLFDLGNDSMLEEISTDESRFRVGDYNPDELAKTHRPGVHQYLMCREAFEVDVVLSLPKLKTHCKVGLTGALKNLVGLNGNKDYLPHHRSGGSERGGDCYPGTSRAKELAEFLEDTANRRLGHTDHALWRHFGRVAKLAARGSRYRMAAAWHGNDTCWRMVLDLNRALAYGRADGELCDEPQRRLYSLTDAIVCGQGDGPLRPNPLAVGAVTFGESPIAAEIVHAALLGLDAHRMRLIREASKPFRWLLASGPVEPETHMNGRVLSVEKVADAYGVAAEPARGWIGQIERVERSHSKLAAG